MVIWITGVTDASNISTATELVTLLRRRGDSVVLLEDGDVNAALSDPVNEMPRSTRKPNAWRLARLTHLVSQSAVNVVVASTVTFNDVLAWNRINLRPYVEVYIRAPLDLRKFRNARGTFYRESILVQETGLEIGPDVPLTPDLVLVNDRSAEGVQDLARRILSYLLVHMQTAALHSGNTTSYGGQIAAG